MANAYQSVIETRQELTADELLAYLVEAEAADRNNRKVSRNLKDARFRYQAAVEQVDYFAPRNLDKNAFLRLAGCQFIQQHQNLIISGPTGTGKSFIASAIGNQACMLNLKTGYFSTSKLLNLLHMAQADGSFARELAKIERLDLLILDDFGLQHFDNKACNFLLEIFEDRHAKHSTIIASQLPVAAWYELFSEKTIADAILDRVIHSAIRIDLNGESLRKIRKA
jgi:DNA replication protein DnaC